MCSYCVMVAVWGGGVSLCVATVSWWQCVCGGGGG